MRKKWFDPALTSQSSSWILSGTFFGTPCMFSFHFDQSYSFGLLNLLFSGRHSVVAAFLQPALEQPALMLLRFLVVKKMEEEGWYGQCTLCIFVLIMMWQWRWLWCDLKDLSRQVFSPHRWSSPAKNLYESSDPDLQHLRGRKDLHQKRAQKTTWFHT